MITIDLVLKVLALIAFGAVRVYWNAAEEEANLKRPSHITKRTHFRNIFKIVEVVFYLIMIVQIFFFPILPFEANALTRVAGVALFLAGLKISVDGRRELGINWNHMIDYQVKQRQALVTDGIYKYVRHPIYAGFLLMLTAMQIILESWVFIGVFAVVFCIIYLQSLKEESILARHFGKEYLKYIHTSKMFFPFIF